jgi:acetyl esterase
VSILSRQAVADSVARLFAAIVNPTPKRGVRFPEIAGRAMTVSIPTRHGDAQATVYHPAPQPNTEPAVYLNIHGGGFVVGHREQDDPWCRYLASSAGVVVVNTDYVLAPKYRFPAPVEQVYDVLQWASSPDRDWDGARLCVGGQSAGGSLAAAAARMAMDNGGPSVALQVLHYAPLDLVTDLANKPSPIGDRAVMRPWMGEVFDTAYIPDRQQRRHRLASPAWGTNGDGLRGIAPALVVTAEFDRLRAEAASYADKLDAAGALVEYYEAAAVDHGYNIMSDSPEAVEATLRTYDLIVDHVVRATTDAREV